MSDTTRLRDPSMSDWARAIIDQRLAEVHVSLPGRIEKYDSTTQKANVQPLLKRPLVDEDGVELDPETLPVIPDVSVAFPRGGGAFISWPLKQGNIVGLVFSERSLDQWLAGNGGVTDPGDFRTHSLSDPYVTPGPCPFSLAIADADPDDLVMAFDGGVAIHIKSNGEIHLGSKNATDALALASKVEAGQQNIVDAIIGGVPGSMDGGLALQSTIIALLTNPVASTGSTVVLAD